MPPRLVRRLLFAPLLVLIAIGFVVLSPLLLLLAAVIPARASRQRVVRLLYFGVAWLVAESATLFASLGLWIASGFGGRLSTEAYQERHYELVGWFLDKLMSVGTRVFRLTVEIDEPPLTPQEAVARLTRPVIVLSRHAGPGDSFLLVHQLLNRYGRRPRIVMKGVLQFDPSLDVVINRLPHAFVWPGRSTGVTDEIRRLAAGLGPTGALVIFPEGGNFTPRRRVRAIQRLERKRRRKEAARARRMDNLLAPHAGGAIAAIEAAPTADVIFVAHTGLDDLLTVRDVWRSLPMEQTLRSKWWRVLAADVPQGRDKQVDWLYDWWERIDSWIEENRPVRTSTA